MDLSTTVLEVEAGGLGEGGSASSEKEGDLKVDTSISGIASALLKGEGGSLSVALGEIAPAASGFVSREGKEVAI